MIELLLFALLGIIFGTALGLLPGMSINNVLPLMLSLAVFLPPHYLAILIISTGVAQIFTAYIPSIFLGAPDADTSHPSPSWAAHRVNPSGSGVRKRTTGGDHR